MVLIMGTPEKVPLILGKQKIPLPESTCLVANHTRLTMPLNNHTQTRLKKLADLTSNNSDTVIVILVRIVILVITAV